MDEKVGSYLITLSIFLEEYKKGTITDQEYKELEQRIAESSGIHPLSVYRVDLFQAKSMRKSYQSKLEATQKDLLNKIGQKK